MKAMDGPPRDKETKDGVCSSVNLNRRAGEQETAGERPIGH